MQPHSSGSGTIGTISPRTAAESALAWPLGVDDRGDQTSPSSLFRLCSARTPKIPETVGKCWNMKAQLNPSFREKPQVRKRERPRSEPGLQADTQIGKIGWPRPGEPAGEPPRSTQPGPP